MANFTKLHASIIGAFATAKAKADKLIADSTTNQNKAIQALGDAHVIACATTKAEYLKGNSKTNEARGEVKALFDSLVSKEYISKNSAQQYAQCFWIAFETNVPFSRDLANKKAEATAEVNAKAEATAKAYTWMPAVKINGALQPGVAYKYFETKGKQNLATLPGLTPAVSGVTQDISVAVKKRASEFSLLFDGYLKIEKNGIYHFTTRSDDGSILYIDDEEVVNNDGDHGSVEAAGKAALKKGYHKIRVAYYDGSGGNELTATIQLENAEKNNLNSKLIWIKK